jgi:hypothetical protein
LPSTATWRFFIVSFGTVDIPAFLHHTWFAAQKKVFLGTLHPDSKATVVCSLPHSPLTPVVFLRNRTHPGKRILSGNRPHP